MLRRKGFRFSRLNGLLDERRRRALDVARAFSRPDGQTRFLHSLRGSPEGMREGILSAIDRKRQAASLNGSGHGARLQLLSEIQGALVSHGVYAEFARPATAGIILQSRLIGDMPAYFVLGESNSSTALFCGRLTQEPDGRRHLAIFVSGASARLMEVMDLWLLDPDAGEDERFERSLLRADRETLRSFLDGKSAGPEEPILLTAINLISMRSCIGRLSALAASSESCSGFLLSALNAQLDSILAHEVAHLVESQAVGATTLPKWMKEIMGYLLEAVHGKADDAFQQLLHREFDFGLKMPGLREDIARRGFGVLLEDSSYLSGWARLTLDEMFVSVSGWPHDQVVDTGAIRAVQSTDFIAAEQMPLVEKAMYNPSNYKPPAR